MIKIIAGLTLLIGMLSGYIASISQGPPFGSTVVGNDYNATSTKNYDGTALTNLTVLKNGSGSLARITITGAGAGVMKFWNATTTNPNLRSSSMSSSTILILTVPASTVAGTYDFDIEFSNGLIYEITGTAPTSTPVWR